MSKPITIILLLLFYIILLTLISRQQHLLSILLCIEGIILFIILYLPLHINYKLMNIRPLIIILLTISVCSARIGLATIIIMCRTRGNDTIINNTYLC